MILRSWRLSLFEDPSMASFNQRRRRGGSSLATIYIVEAVKDIANTIILTYNRPIDHIVWDPASFKTKPANTQPTSAEPLDETTLELGFGGSISTQTALEFSGNTPSVLTPQTISLT